MRIMTTIYLNDEHIKHFKDNTDDSMSHVIRKLLDRYIESERKRKLRS